MNVDFLTKILEADISRETKEKILSYWLLPQSADKTETPIQETAQDERVGSVKRPSKEDIDLKNNPKAKEEKEEMEKTLDEVI